jgi:hypothetical protein
MNDRQLRSRSKPSHAPQLLPTSDKPHHCPYCPEVFATQRGVTTHSGRVHLIHPPVMAPQFQQVVVTASNPEIRQIHHVAAPELAQAYSYPSHSVYYQQLPLTTRAMDWVWYLYSWITTIFRVLSWLGSGLQIVTTVVLLLALMSSAAYKGYLPMALFTYPL